MPFKSNPRCRNAVGAVVSNVVVQREALLYLLDFCLYNYIDTESKQSPITCGSPASSSDSLFSAICKIVSKGPFRICSGSVFPSIPKPFLCATKMGFGGVHFPPFFIIFISAKAVKRY